MERISFLLAVLFVSSHMAIAAPDEELLGKAQGYPVGTRATWFYDEAVRVGSFTNLDTILPYNTLPRSDTPSPFKRATSEPGFRYQYEGRSYTIDDYLQHQRVMGLLIIKDGEILVERYQSMSIPNYNWSWCTPQQQKMPELARKPWELSLVLYGVV